MAFDIEDSYEARTVRTAETTDSTIYLSSLPTDATAGYLVLAPGTSKEERISFTGTAGAGTASDPYNITGVTKGLDNYDEDTAVTANKFKHIAGTKVIMALTHNQLFNKKKNTLLFGDNADTDKDIEVDNGDTNNPFLRYDASENKWVASNNGVDTIIIGGSTATFTPGDGIDITTSIISLDIKANRGLVITSTELDTKIEASEGLTVGANGLAIDKTQSYTWAAEHTFSAGINTAAQDALQLNPFGTSAGETGEIQFLELAAGGTNYVGFKAADALAGNVIWTLPDADGNAGEFIKTDAAGTLSFSGATKLYATVTDVTVASTTTETDLISFTLPANVLGTANAAMVRIYINNFSVNNGSVAFAVTYGSTKIVDTGFTDLGTPTGLLGFIDVILLGAGTTGSQEASLSVDFSENGKLGALVEARHRKVGTASEDSTGALTLAVSIDWGINNAGNTITMSHAVVYKIA